jgi:hypothetical protein
MRLNVVRLNVVSDGTSAEAYAISQRKAIFSSGPAIGTNNLFNCLGIVIHNRASKTGVIAHVEAQTTKEKYLIDIDNSLKKMMRVINENSRVMGSLVVVLTGNCSGDVEFSQQLSNLIYKHVGAGFRLNRSDFMDSRNVTSGRIGGAVAISGGVFGGFAYSPDNEKLVLLCAGQVITSPSSGKDKTYEFDIQ